MTRSNERGGQRDLFAQPPEPDKEDAAPPKSPEEATTTPAEAGAEPAGTHPTGEASSGPDEGSEEAAEARPTDDTAGAAPDVSGEAAEPAPPPASESAPPSAGESQFPESAADAEAPEPPDVPREVPDKGYEVLALRYRPQTFRDLVGQDAIARTLRNAIKKDRIWNAFVFAGPRGVGKTTTARILAKALNCRKTEGANPDPCSGPSDSCISCREIKKSRSRDVAEIDGASHSGVDRARELIETAHYAPNRDRFRIFLVDEVHMLSGPAFNALLKTLEEPPPHVKFLFATTEIHKIPPTVLSRCQEFEFRTVAPQVIADRLRWIADDQKIEVTDDALKQIARLGQGSLRDALSAFDQVIGAVDGPIGTVEVSDILGVPDVALCRQVAAAIADGDRRAVFGVVSELMEGGRDLRHFVLLLTHYLRDIVVVRAAPDAAELLEWPGERAQLTEFAKKFSDEDLLRSLDVLTQAEQGLRWSPEPRFHLEMALLKLVEMPRLAAFDELLAALQQPPPAGGSSKRSRKAAPASSPAAAAAPPAGRPSSEVQGAERRPAEPASAIEVEPPAVVREYQKTFGGEILSTKRIASDAA